MPLDIFDMLFISPKTLWTDIYIYITANPLCIVGPWSLQVFKCGTFRLNRCCDEWEGMACRPVDYTR